MGQDNVANHYFDYRIGAKTVKGIPTQEAYNQYKVGPRDNFNDNRLGTSRVNHSSR